MIRFLAALLITAVAARAADPMDPTRAASFCQARSTLRDSMSQADPATRAKLFRAYWEFTKEARPPYYAENQVIDKEWFDCGFSQFESEGTVYLTVAGKTLLEFVPQLPPDLAAYIKFSVTEAADPIAEDAALLISWDQLRERLARWEAFARDHAQLPETKLEVQPEAGRLLSIYLHGMDNTPVIDATRGLVNLDLIQSWKIFVERNRDSQFYREVASFLRRVEAQGGKIDLTP